jgi:hypothetical protein
MARVQSKHAATVHKGTSNLIPNRPGATGEERRGGRAPGTPNHINRLLKEAAMVGWAAAGDHLMQMALIEEEEAIEKANANARNGEWDPEDAKEVRLARLFARRPGGLEGYLAYAAIKDIRGTLGFMGKVLPLQLHASGGTTVDVNANTGTVTVKNKMTLDEMEEHLKARGLPGLTRLIDVTPTKVKNPKAADPNPMETQEALGIEHHNPMATDEEDDE